MIFKFFQIWKNRVTGRIFRERKSLKMAIFTILAKMASISRLHTCFYKIFKNFTKIFTKKCEKLNA